MIKANIQFESQLRKEIIELAIKQYHKKYQHGKMGPDTFDCAGFVWYVYNTILGVNIFDDGIGLSKTTKIMTSRYGKLTIFDENSLKKELHLIKVGDILLFHRQSLNDSFPKPDNKYPGHCGIYLGNEKFIHASSRKKKIIITDFKKNNYWLSVLVGTKDISYSFDDIIKEKEIRI